MTSSKRAPWLAVAMGFLLLFTVAGLGASSPTQAAMTTFTLNLTGAEENPPVDGAGKAFGSFTFDDSTRVLTYTINVMGLASDQVTASHIHRGARGVNGPVIYPLSGAGVTHIKGSVTLTTADVNDLMAGNLYVNVHSLANPGGFARAQLDLSAGGAPAPAAIDAAIRKTVNDIFAAWNAGDAKTFLSYWTDAGLTASFDFASRAEAEQGLPEFIGSVPLTLRSLSNITSTSPSLAAARMELAFGGIVQLSDLRFVLVGGIWKVDNEVYLDVPLPAGTRSVDMKLQEFAFVYDKAQVANGNFAFKVSNVGKQDHELVLVKIDPGINLQQALQSSSPEDEGPPPGITDVGSNFWGPGEGGNFVLTQALSNGHYGLLCFVPDTDGTPHAFKGMVSEFDVTGSTATAPVRPPNTGDAGLMATDTSKRSVSAGLLVLGLMAVIGGAASLKLVSQRA